MSEEITVKQMIIASKRTLNHLLSKWKLIVVWGVIGGLTGLSYSLLSKKVYEAELTFALEEKSGGLGGYAAIASQFGIDLGKGSESGAFVGENIIELFKSRLIIENALLNEVNFSDGKDLLINRFLKMNVDEDKLQDLFFQPQQSNRANFSRSQDSVLAMVSNAIKKDLLVVDKINKRLNIIKVSVQSRDEEFSKLFCEQLAKNVSELYVETKTRRSRANIAILEFKVDSVRQALNNEMYGAAINMDENLNPARSELRVPYMKKQMNVQLLTTVYGELLKNLELSKLSLMREEPIIQIIDKPIYPLKYKRPGKIKSTIIFGFLSGFLIVAYTLLKLKYKEWMHEE
jgi:uncharacterized protein involved in exopolysaccharide biosynthesis